MALPSACRGGGASMMLMTVESSCRAEGEDNGNT